MFVCSEFLCVLGVKFQISYIENAINQRDGRTEGSFLYSEYKYSLNIALVVPYGRTSSVERSGQSQQEVEISQAVKSGYSM